MYEWISQFLKDRTIQVRVGKELSERVRLENRTPQGSVLSPILFLIMMNDVPDTEDSVKLSMLADDCSIWKSGDNLQHNASLVQNYFNKFHDWCDTWGFKISKTKTSAVIFTRKNDQESLIRMKIGDENIR